MTTKTIASTRILNERQSYGLLFMLCGLIMVCSAVLMFSLLGNPGLSVLQHQYLIYLLGGSTIFGALALAAGWHSFSQGSSHPFQGSEVK